jgi:hypothetical protein
MHAPHAWISLPTLQLVHPWAAHMASCPLPSSNLCLKFLILANTTWAIVLQPESSQWGSGRSFEGTLLHENKVVSAQNVPSMYENCLLEAWMAIIAGYEVLNTHLYVLWLCNDGWIMILVNCRSLYMKQVQIHTFVWNYDIGLWLMVEHWMQEVCEICSNLQKDCCDLDGGCVAQYPWVFSKYKLRRPREVRTSSGVPKYCRFSSVRTKLALHFKGAASMKGVYATIRRCAPMSVGCKWGVWRCRRGTKRCRKTIHAYPNFAEPWAPLYIVKFIYNATVAGVSCHKTWHNSFCPRMHK